MRLSIGLEDVEDLRADLALGLAAAVPAGARGGGVEVSRLQHFGYFFSRGFGPQGWGRADWAWGYDWTPSRPLPAGRARTWSSAGFDLVVIEDAVSLGQPRRPSTCASAPPTAARSTTRCCSPRTCSPPPGTSGSCPTVNAGITPPYLAARQAATLQHLSGDRFGINVVTDVGSARHVGLEPVAHDAAYDRAEEWIDVVRRLWRSWDADALVADPGTGHFADGSPDRRVPPPGRALRRRRAAQRAALRRRGTGGRLPGGSPRGLAFAGTHSDVQLALRAAAASRGGPGLPREGARGGRARAGASPRTSGSCSCVKPEIVASREEADRVVAASRHPSDAVLRAVALAWSSDLETDLTVLDLDAPVTRRVFGEHVSRGTIGCAARGHPATPRCGNCCARKARKGRSWPTAADWSGPRRSSRTSSRSSARTPTTTGSCSPGTCTRVTLHRFLDDLVPVLRRRGILRTGYGGGGLRGNLFEF